MGKTKIGVVDRLEEVIAHFNLFERDGSSLKGGRLTRGGDMDGSKTVVFGMDKM